MTAAELALDIGRQWWPAQCLWSGSHTCEGGSFCVADDAADDRGAGCLAARGYTTLSILSRHAAGYYSIPQEAGSADLKAAVDWLAGLGIRDVVLAGHSFGSARIALYAAQSGDARVKALVHYAPAHRPISHNRVWRTPSRSGFAVSRTGHPGEPLLAHRPRRRDQCFGASFP